MKPYVHSRKAQGYCCINCDGPYKEYKRRTKHGKAKDKKMVKKTIEMVADPQEYYDYLNTSGDWDDGE